MRHLIEECRQCFGVRARDEQANSYRWAGETPVSTAFTSEKQMCYSASEVDVENTDDVIEYVVCTVFDGGNNDSIRADLKKVRTKFEGTQTEALINWKAKVAAGIFQSIFRSLRYTDITNMDDKTPGFFGRINKTLADMCRWVIEHGTEIFAWPAEYVQEHKKEIAIALLCACTVAVLWEVMPWVLGELGFEATGVRAGSLGAQLMKKYMGTIPKDSWMSFFQRLGAKWGQRQL